MKLTKLKNELKEEDAKLMQVTAKEEYLAIISVVNELRSRIEVELGGGECDVKDRSE